MSSFLYRLMGRPRSIYDFDMAALQLRTLVAMVHADDQVHMLEADELLDFIDRIAGSRRDHERLEGMLDPLMAAPPDLETVLEELARHTDVAGLGRGLVSGLAAVAASDHSIDHREAFMLDLVCDVFGLEQAALDDDQPGADELDRFVHQLARAARAA